MSETINKGNYLRNVEVNTPLGKRLLTYRHIEPTVDEDGYVRTNGVDCDKQCPYGKICQFFPDPRHPEKCWDKDDPSTFCDFCADIPLNQEKYPEDSRMGKNIEEFKSYVPVEGTIENNLGDVFPSIIDIIKEKNPLIRVSTVIDRVCDGVCEFYDKDHTQCNFSNSMCLLRNIFVGPNPTTEMDVCENKYETDRPSRINPNPFVNLFKEKKEKK